MRTGPPLEQWAILAMEELIWRLCYTRRNVMTELWAIINAVSDDCSSHYRHTTALIGGKFAIAHLIPKTLTT